MGYVNRAIRAMNKSPGSASIPVQILKDAVHLVQKPLAQIYNVFLENGTLPLTWEFVRVSPIYKIGHITDVIKLQAHLNIVNRIEDTRKARTRQINEVSKRIQQCVNQSAFQILFNAVPCLVNFIDTWLKYSEVLSKTPASEILFLRTSLL